MLPILPTTVAGSYPQPAWLVDHEALRSRTVPREGVWHQQGRALRGPDEVLAAVRERPAGRVTAHLVQNLVVDPMNRDEATACYLSLVYCHDGPAGADEPAPLSTPLSISAVSDRLRRVNGEWMVVERRPRRLFGG